MIGHSIGPSVMLQLGSFQFGLTTAAYQELTRHSGWRWASQDRFGQEPALQSTGPESQTMTLTGTVYAEFRGGTGQLDAMRALANKQAPQQLIDGNGKMLGRWVIESVEEKQSVFAAKGYPRKQEFTLQLKKFPGAVLNGLPASTAASKVFGPVEAKPPTVIAGDVSSIKAGVSKFVEGASSAAGKAAETMTSALASVQAKAAEIGNAVGPVIATAQRGIAAAKNLQSQVLNVKQSLGNLNSLANIQSAMFGVESAASAAANAGALAADAAKSLGISLPVDVPTIDPSALIAINDCRVACGKMATTATSIYNDADKLKQLATGTAIA